MDTRVINTLYSPAAMQLFVNLANLCLSVPPEDGPPNVPYLVPSTGGRMIAQEWGRCPASAGVTVYWSLAEDGKTVQMWDPEVQDEEPGNIPPLYTFRLNEMAQFIRQWLVGAI